MTNSYEAPFPCPYRTCTLTSHARPDRHDSDEADVPVPKVNLEALVDAAADIADTDGIDAVTMRRLAERCGVGVMTIYGYVRTKEELLAVLADRYLAEIELPDPSMRWQDQLVTLYCSVREVMLKHPTLVPIIANQRLDTQVRLPRRRGGVRCTAGDGDVRS